MSEPLLFDERDAEAIAIIARIRTQLRLDERQELHVSRADEAPTDPQGPEALFDAWFRQRIR